MCISPRVSFVFSGESEKHVFVIVNEMLYVKIQDVNLKAFKFKVLLYIMS